MLLNHTIDSYDVCTMMGTGSSGFGATVEVFTETYIDELTCLRMVMVSLSQYRINVLLDLQYRITVLLDPTSAHHDAYHTLQY